MTECPHTYQSPTKFTKANGAVVVKMQCNRCGRGLQERPKSDFELENLMVFNEEKWKEWQRRDEEKRRTEYLEGSSEKSEAWWKMYNEYIASDHWYKLRRIVLDRDVICQVCFFHRSTEGHHFSYRSLERWGVSFAGECAGVCKECHDRLHPHRMGGV